ncbi:hypothetical protein OG209_39450 [Streptomyces sp. NBC_01383]|nr:hypothetical protein [Streptomyces sp. CEV 2-1]
MEVLERDRVLDDAAQRRRQLVPQALDDDDAGLAARDLGSGHHVGV